MRAIRGIGGFLFGLTLLAGAQAATVSKFSPVGEVIKVRQVRATFSEPAIKFGDPKAPSPFDIKCSEAGTGRWADDRNWIYDFVRDLPPGTRCGFSLKADFKSLAGAAFTGKTAFEFSTGGPAVLNHYPDSYEPIEEEQIFVLVQNGPATEASVRQNVYCEAEGVHERIPVKLVAGAVRTDLLKHFSLQNEAERVSTLQCQQRLPNGVKMHLVWGAGVATQNGVLTTQPQKFKFDVRPAFAATFSCERENAAAACAPILPVRLKFSATVSRKLAQEILFRAGDGKKLKPHFEATDKEESVSGVIFNPPFAEKSNFTIELPRNFRDETGRELSNAGMFPLKSRMAEYPPLAKFPAAPFGIIELNADPALPVTLRRVEENLMARVLDAQGSPGTVAKVKVEGDAAILAWLAKLNRYHESSVTIGKQVVETRSIGLLAREPGAQKLQLPASDVKEGVRPFEVIGIPLKEPGFYVVELESQKLGAALLGRPEPMYVRTSALVTNLAVHVKSGRENGAAWVTTLDGARPVADADVRLSDCRGVQLWRGRTDKNGLAMLPPLADPYCSGAHGEGHISGHLVSARKTDEKGRADMAFALTSWNHGIEPWRFNLPTDNSRESTVRAHTVFDRTLFRAGETASMKHVIRTQALQGFGLLPEGQLPNRVRIIHQGSDQEFQFPLKWRGEKSAETVFAIPKQAKLGRYEVVLDTGTPKNLAAEGEDRDETHESRYGRRTYNTGSFRVEEFRLPLLQGRITPQKATQGALVAPREVPVDLQLNYLNGGGASGQAVTVSAMLRGKYVNFPAYEEYTFQSASQAGEDSQRVVADKLAVTLDKSGAGKTTIKDLPALKTPQDLVTEMTYADPNGEIQTISAVTPIWPAGVVVGIKTSHWVSVRKKLTLTGVTLDHSGRPQAGVPVEFSGILKQTNSHRKRMVGGFYAYENTDTSKDLGTLCSGKSDSRGLVLCEIELSDAGNVELTASARDGNGKTAVANSSIWVTQRGEVWFDAQNQDRIDVLPEKKRYEPGDTAKFQVRMPFRHATALVAIEREGVIETQVVQLNGQDPTISVKVKDSYAPNVYVSVLAVRGRMREVPWYSFFTWGWKEPVNWWTEFREYQAPSATVDLSKPAFKYGIGEIAVGVAAHKLGVTVTADKPSYPIRSTARVSVRVNLPNGKPAAGAEVAFAAVDEALLELQPNSTWDLLSAMLQRRSYGVDTATAQMQVIGKRHYGRKAVAAGGGGGASRTRELFDTLLLWKPAVVLDANGRAQLDVPLNDSLTSFKLVAVADAGAAMFGTGSVSIRSTQDLQLISGLPPLVREGDSFSAMVTVRNTTTRAMQVEVSARAPGITPEPAPQKVSLAAGEVRELAWQANAPNDVQQVSWEINALENGGQGVKDAIRITQKVAPAVPVTVQQATLFQLDKSFSMAVAQPADSLPGRGGLNVALAPSLIGTSEGLRRFFLAYPYTCLEQRASRAMGLRDEGMWQGLMNELPTYLDADGLAHYYPPGPSGTHGGSDALTAYLLAASHEVNYSLPEQARDRMLAGLAAFVEGRITREFWAPKKDLEARKLAAMEALSRYGRMQPRMLDSIQILPNLWPTSAVLDWMNILQRNATLPERDKRLAEADQILRSRLNFQGTRMGFSTEDADFWWWLMLSADVNANRMILTVLNDPAWRDDLPRLINGAISRQRRGHWLTTTANVWGSLALEKFARKFETEKVAGVTRASLQQGGAQAAVQTYTWGPNGGGKLQLPWPAANTAARPEDGLKLAHEGKGKPWVTVQSLAAVPLKTPFSSGYRIVKTITPVEQKDKNAWSRGDILRVNLEIDAQADMTWVVVSDPIPAGASVLGTGLGRDSAIAVKDEKSDGNAWPVFQERSFEAFRGYYAYVPKGKFSLSYTIRLNNAGMFGLPQTRVEAMYAPEMFGESPNPKLTVK